MISAHYDAAFRPPAPLIAVTALHPTTGRPAELQGKLDTGSDICVVPDTLPGLLGLMPNGFRITRAYDGTYSRRPLYHVDLRVGAWIGRRLRCIAVRRANVLLGRNLLNRLVMTLDGPALELHVRIPDVG